MTQLILDVDGYNVALPESRKQAYSAYREDLGTEVVMTSGRLTKEVKGTVWRVKYQYGYFNDETKNNVIAACEKGRRQSITCGFLPPNSSGTLTYSKFIVITFTYPQFMWSRLVQGETDFFPVPMWGDFAIELREVKPSD